MRIASILLLLALGRSPLAAAQQPTISLPEAGAVAQHVDSLLPKQPATGLGKHTHRVSQQLDQLRPVFEWKWGAILATALAMVGAIVAALPVALVYRHTKGPRDYDPGVMHSSIILAPTIAAILMVIQGSLAMAFSLAGVVTAVRFRNSLKDTNDAVYVFVAVAIGLAAGGQALDIAVAISVVFCTSVLLLSMTPLRAASDPPAGDGSQHEHHHHHHHHYYDLPDDSRPMDGAGPAEHAHSVSVPSNWDPSRVEYLRVLTPTPESARASIEAVLERETKDWRLAESTPNPGGEAALVYLIYRRKHAPMYWLISDIEAAARAEGISLTAKCVPLSQPPEPIAGGVPGIHLYPSQN